RTPTYASEDEHLFKYSPGSLQTFLEPLARALAMNCPLAVGKRLPEELGRVALKVERKAEDVEKAIEAQRKRLKEAEKQVGALADKLDRRVYIKGVGWISAGLFFATLGGCECLIQAIKNRPTRRRLRTGSVEVDAAIATYKQAVTAMSALPSGDPRSWSAQAAI